MGDPRLDLSVPMDALRRLRRRHGVSARSGELQDERDSKMGVEPSPDGRFRAGVHLSAPDGAGSSVQDGEAVVVYDKFNQPTWNSKGF